MKETSTELTLRQAAELARVSERTIYRWIRRHSLPARESDAGLSIKRHDLERWLQSRRPRRSRTAADVPDVRQHLLESTLRVAEQVGPAALTLEAVAAEARTTLGAITYHFADKHDLLEAVVEAFVAEVKVAWRRSEDAGEHPVAAYLAMTLAPERELARARVVFLIAGSNARLRSRLRRQIRAWYRRITREARRDADIVRCLAADALWLFGLLGGDILDANVVGRVRADIVRHPRSHDGPCHGGRVQ